MLTRGLLLLHSSRGRAEEAAETQGAAEGGRHPHPGDGGSETDARGCRGRGRPRRLLLAAHARATRSAARRWERRVAAPTVAAPFLVDASTRPETLTVGPSNREPADTFTHRTHVSLSSEPRSGVKVVADARERVTSGGAEAPLVHGRSSTGIAPLSRTSSAWRHGLARRGGRFSQPSSSSASSPPPFGAYANVPGLVRRICPVRSSKVANPALLFGARPRASSAGKTSLRPCIGRPAARSISTAAAAAPALGDVARSSGSSEAKIACRSAISRRSRETTSPIGVLRSMVTSQSWRTIPVTRFRGFVSAFCMRLGKSTERLGTMAVSGFHIQTRRSV